MLRLQDRKSHKKKKKTYWKHNRMTAGDGIKSVLIVRQETCLKMESKALPWTCSGLKSGKQSNARDSYRMWWPSKDGIVFAFWSFCENKRMKHGLESGKRMEEDVWDIFTRTETESTSWKNLKDLSQKKTRIEELL